MFMLLGVTWTCLPIYFPGTLTAPMIYTFMWLTIFGGAAIKTERLAANAELCCPGWNSTVLQFNQEQVILETDTWYLKQTRVT